ncbi:MAG: ABC transporter permease subunit [Spirochaetes bacterium]|nr:ABC transporter permease subunit [Spirochaetota bacterium]
MFIGIWSIFKKEVKSYFNSSIAYIFLILFLLIPNILFFYILGGIFKENSATMRTFFSMLPYVFIIFIPGLTMGAWAKEKNTGTIELLFTLPVSQMEVLLGKFIAALTLVIIALASTLAIPALTDIFLGSFDWGQIRTQYFGAVLMAGSYIAITFFLSSLTMELINSFLLSSSLLVILTIIGYLSQAIKFPAFLDWLKVLFAQISLSTHFTNFSKGVIDSRDVFYYIGIIVIFFYMNLQTLENKKWG